MVERCSTLECFFISSCQCLNLCKFISQHRISRTKWGGIRVQIVSSITDWTFNIVSLEPHSPQHVHRLKATVPHILYAHKQSWSVWRFDSSRFFLQTHACSHLSEKTLRSCECVMEQTSQLCFLFPAEEEEPAAKTEDYTTTKSTMEMEGKIWFSWIWCDLIWFDLNWLRVWLTFYQCDFLVLSGVFVYLCVELLWSALFLLSAVCQTSFPLESVSAYLRSAVSPMYSIITLDRKYWALQGPSGAIMHFWKPWWRC